MSIRIKPTTGQIYHVYNRGVEKRKIFTNKKDYLRFIHDLFEFNDKEPALNAGVYFDKQTQTIEVGLQYVERRPRKRLVDLMVFTLMPNHYHLIAKQRIEGGITEFMRKLGTGYTNYFNKKYGRVGPLFQGKYKLEVIKNDAHFLHLPYYIHANPLDLTMSAWRSGTMRNYKQAIKFLEKYQWSSFPDYIGKKKFPSVTQREFLLEFSGGPERYKKDFMLWLKEKELDEIKHLTLED